MKKQYENHESEWREEENQRRGKRIPVNQDSFYPDAYHINDHLPEREEENAK